MAITLQSWWEISTKKIVGLEESCAIRTAKFLHYHIDTKNVRIGKKSDKSPYSFPFLVFNTRFASCTVIIQGGRGIHRHQPQILRSHPESKAEFGSFELSPAEILTVPAGPLNPLCPWGGKSSCGSCLGTPLD